jgi:hypothetical protein
LTSLFDVASLSSVVPITLQSTEMVFQSGGTFSAPSVTLQFPIQANGYGEYRCFVRVLDDSKAAALSVQSTMERVTVQAAWSKVSKMGAYVSQCGDDIAVALMALSKLPNTGRRSVELGLIQQKLDVLLSSSHATPAVVERLRFL